MYLRIIPRLDIKGPNLVKGVHLEGLRVLGKPERFARHYYEHGADELIYMDVVASLYGRNSLSEIVARTSREIFIPLTVGGGLRSVEDVRSVLRAGADKVSINTAAVRRPELIRELSRRFGSSTVVVSIEAKRRVDGAYEPYTDNGRERTGLDAVQWAIRAAEMGAGEILLTSIDREGTGSGFELDLVHKVSAAIPIPVIACGGAGNAGHLISAVRDSVADAVSVASVLHYRYIRENYSAQDFTTEGNVEFLRSRRDFTRVEGATLEELKLQLGHAGVETRPVETAGHA